MWYVLKYYLKKVYAPIIPQFFWETTPCKNFLKLKFSNSSEDSKSASRPIFGTGPWDEKDWNFDLFEDNSLKTLDFMKFALTADINSVVRLCRSTMCAWRQCDGNDIGAISRNPYNNAHDEGSFREFLAATSLLARFQRMERKRSKRTATRRSNDTQLIVDSSQGGVGSWPLYTRISKADISISLALFVSLFLYLLASMYTISVLSWIRLRRPKQIFGASPLKTRASQRTSWFVSLHHDFQCLFFLFWPDPLPQPSFYRSPHQLLTRYDYVRRCSSVPPPSGP